MLNTAVLADNNFTLKGFKRLQFRSFIRAYRTQRDVLQSITCSPPVEECRLRHPGVYLSRALEFSSGARGYHRIVDRLLYGQRARANAPPRVSKTAFISATPLADISGAPAYYRDKILLAAIRLFRISLIIGSRRYYYYRHCYYITLVLRERFELFVTIRNRT